MYKCALSANMTEDLDVDFDGTVIKKSSKNKKRAISSPKQNSPMDNFENSNGSDLIQTAYNKKEKEEQINYEWVCKNVYNTKFRKYFHFEHFL